MTPLLLLRYHIRMSLVELLSSAEGRGAGLSISEAAEVHRLATELEQTSMADDTNDSPLLPGRWRVLYQGKPGGETVSAFSIESWRKCSAQDLQVAEACEATLRNLPADK